MTPFKLGKNSLPKQSLSETLGVRTSIYKFGATKFNSKHSPPSASAPKVILIWKKQVFSIKRQNQLKRTKAPKTMPLWKGIVLMESRVLARWVSMKDQPFPREARNTGGMMRRTTNRRGKRNTAEESTPSGMRAADGVAGCLPVQPTGSVLLWKWCQECPSGSPGTLTTDKRNSTQGPPRPVQAPGALSSTFHHCHVTDRTYQLDCCVEQIIHCPEGHCSLPYCPHR